MVNIERRAAFRPISSVHRKGRNNESCCLFLKIRVRMYCSGRSAAELRRGLAGERYHLGPASTANLIEIFALKHDISFAKCIFRLAAILKHIETFAAKTCLDLASHPEAARRRRVT